MKKTLEIPDSVYRQVKACATVRGETVKAFLMQAIKDKVTLERNGRIVRLHRFDDGSTNHSGLS